jgi:hypothetical protein
MSSAAKAAGPGATPVTNPNGIAIPVPLLVGSNATPEMPPLAASPGFQLLSRRQIPGVNGGANEISCMVPKEVVGYKKVVLFVVNGGSSTSDNIVAGPISVDIL